MIARRCGTGARVPCVSAALPIPEAIPAPPEEAAGCTVDAGDAAGLHGQLAQAGLRISRRLWVNARKRNRDTNRRLWQALGMTTQTVGAHGRVVIPADVRHDLGLDVGAEIVTYVDHGRYVIEGRDASIARLQDEWQAAFAGSGSPVDELIASRRAEAKAEEAERVGDDESAAPIRRAASQ